MDEEEYIEDEELEKGSDLDRVRAILASEGEGIDEIDQLIEMATDPQLKEMAEAIKQDESKHKAALEQWLEMQDEADADPEDEGEEEQIEADADPDDGISEEDLFGDETEPEEEATSDLIDDIREVLAEHEAEKAEDEEPEEDEDEDEDLPEFLKEDDEDEEDEDEVSKVMKSYRVPIIVAKGSDQQIVYGVVSEPNVIDLQGDRLSKSEIRAACHKFMQTSQRIGKEHSGVAKASIIESYIAPTDFKCNGQVVKSGSWVMAVKIHDPALWQA
ncbi:MAG TPA: XkdF-like putative serine protease domain-containing protein, partial [Methanothrix sp.]|nr:XkdF-like putative serine protease domain-containing protein [Methanothrix sp.]